MYFPKQDMYYCMNCGTEFAILSLTTSTYTAELLGVKDEET